MCSVVGYTPAEYFTKRGKVIFFCTILAHQKNGGGAFSWATNAYGIHVEDITGAAVTRLLELGPATPYLRVVGGAAPGANQSNVYFLEQATLRRLQTKDGAAVGGGDRVCVAV